LKAHVSPDIKLRAKAVADREFLSQAAWLKRLILREIRAVDLSQAGEGESSSGERMRCQGRVAQLSKDASKPILLRLRNEDRLLLNARAEARAPLRTDARPQVISYRGGHACRCGTDAPNPEGPVLIERRRRDRTLFFQTPLGTCTGASLCPSTTAFRRGATTNATELTCSPPNRTRRP
jgi:hypothetical protein